MADDDKKTDNDKQTAAPALPDDVMQGLRNLVTKQADGDKQEALKILYDDNKKLRDKVRELEGNVPEEGAIVLTGDEAESYSKLQEMGGFKAVREKLENAQADSKRLKELERTEQYRTAAEVAGITNFDAFAGLMNGEKIDVEGEEDEKEVYVTYKDGDEEKRVKLEEYEKLQPYKASLFGGSQEEGKDGQKSSFPKIPAGGNPPKDGATVEDIKEQKAQSGDYNL